MSYGSLILWGRTEEHERENKTNLFLSKSVGLVSSIPPLLGHPFTDNYYYILMVLEVWDKPTQIDINRSQYWRAYTSKTNSANLS